MLGGRLTFNQILKMEETKQIKYSPLILIAGVIMSLIKTIFVSIIYLFRGLILSSRLLDIILFTLILWWLSPLTFVYSLFIIILIEIVLIIIFDFKIIKESIETDFFSTINYTRLMPIWSRFVRKERGFLIQFLAHPSPKIIVNGGAYIVIELGTLNPIRENKMSGFLILDYSNGELIKNEELLKDILRVYNCWRYIYFNKILGDDIKIQTVPLIKTWIKFENKFKGIIEKRKLDNYQEISKIKDENFIKILKTLDDEVINQYPYIINKLETELKIFEEIYDIFTKPSLGFYQEFIEDINLIANMSTKENEIWMHRLRTWRELYQYQNIEIEKLPNPSLKKIWHGLIVDLIKYFISKEKQHPIGRETIDAIITEGSKKAKKETLKFLNRYVNYHIFGIKAIEGNIELNKNLKKIRDKYKQIWGSNDLSKIRNLEES